MSDELASDELTARDTTVGPTADPCPAGAPAGAPRRSIESLARATPTEARDYWALFEAELAHDDGAAAREHLAAGRPIEVLEPDTPPGHVVRQHPDGRRELVRVGRDGDVIVGLLPPR